ncbi:MAG: Rieske (2Fe-2S) protein [Verrucomicrobia bacterium]|nr:Rieske (2Fe-2S) protein [Verrucomicrobiota bacterium]MDE3098644.1 Rieske (2Fe-2S) protein [Verrucomicrobiota bacterium]
MKISRREFLILTAMFAAGCSSTSNAVMSSAGKERIVNAGPVAGYAKDGVYAAFRSEGFFVIRRGEKLMALSSICTHRACKVKAEPDDSFYCPCHGSTFDAQGHVTHGPARRSLPDLQTRINADGHLLVTAPPIRGA